MSSFIQWKWSLIRFCLSFSLSVNICHVSGSLTDAHILELSKRITNESELMDLGVKVLELPDFLIKTAMYDNTGKIQPATHETLSRWLKNQNNRQEAYKNLYTGLGRSGMNQLAAELKQWVERTAAQTLEERRQIMDLVFLNVFLTVMEWNIYHCSLSQKILLWRRIK